MCQDRDGFIWFATNNGLSRFNGKNFKIFTVNDGLPDNEILKVYADSLGRVWIASFKNEVCYYEKGKIYNKENKRELDYNPIYGRVTEFLETKAGTIMIITANTLFKYTYGDSIRLQLENEINQSRVIKPLGPGPRWFGNKLSLVLNDSLFFITDSGLVFYREFISFSGQKYLYGIPLNNSDTPNIVLDHDIISASTRNQYVYFISTINGAVEVNPATMKPIMEFLPGKVVTKAIIDKEGSYWFATLGDGVFKLANKDVLTLRPYEQANSWNEVFSISTSGNRVLTGNFQSQMIDWNMKKGYTTHSFSSYLDLAENKLATNRLNSIFSLDDGNKLLGFDAFLVKWDGKVKNIIPLSAIKSISGDDQEHVVIATGLGVKRVNFKTFKVTEEIWQKRSTSAVRIGNKYYIGTLDGLIELDGTTKKFKNVTFHPSLARRITDLKVSDSSLWVATSDSGVVQITNGKVVKTFSENSGLNSNNCRVIYLYENSIWIGTNKGICKLDLQNPNSFPLKYDTDNLLPSDIINAIFIKNGMIY
jgi:hypothetical protein